MPTYFIAVRQGSGRATRADGWLIANQQIFAARSGRLLSDTDPKKIKNGVTTERGELPPGSYEIGWRQGLNEDGSNKLTMSDGRRDQSVFQKFEIKPAASNKDRVKMRNGTWGVRDARYPGEPRSLLRFHYDGDLPGSEGCIVYDDMRAQAALTAAQDNKDTAVIVEYPDTVQQARARVKAITGRDPP